MCKFTTLLVVALVLVTAACLPAPPTPISTQTPTPSLTPSPSPVWFPPTSTPTVVPTTEPTLTPDLRPNRGEELLRDDFSSGEDWSLTSSNTASVAIANNHITLALNQSKSFLLTTRQQPVLGDFYAEISASPNLCSGADEYGLLVRVSPGLEYFRFSLSCDGRARADRVYRGTVASIVPWTLNGAIPASAPSSSRLAVWAKGEELRFFINDLYLFSVRDTTFYTGTIGLFVRTAGETAVSVNFADLIVYQLTQ